MAQLLPTKRRGGVIQDDPEHSAGENIQVIPRLHGESDRRARSWRVIAYAAAFLPLLFLVAFARLWPDFNRQEIPDWIPVLELADAARVKGDFIGAKGLYSHAGRLASWQDDWAGLLASACGLHMIDKDVGPYSSARIFLLRAMIAAEEKQSRAGIQAVARTFTALGAHEAAAMVVARVRSDWPEKPEAADVYKSDCW